MANYLDELDNPIDLLTADIAGVAQSTNRTIKELYEKVVRLEIMFKQDLMAVRLGGIVVSKRVDLLSEKTDKLMELLPPLKEWSKKNVST